MLLAAYKRGIFPWYSEGEPLLWWSPDPRMVLHTANLKVSRSLAKSMRNRGYKVSVDTAFELVIARCAGPRNLRQSDGGADGQSHTWLSAEMRNAYLGLHRLGYAHSFETWLDDELVGGLYGISIGRMFYGESMFSRSRDASKVALVALARALRRRGYPMIDCQMNTPHLASLGACEIKRVDFLRAVCTLVNYPEPAGRWRCDADPVAALDEAQCQD